MPTYAVTTYDPDSGEFTPDALDGRLTVGLTLAGVLRVCRWLREIGCAVRRKRLPNGDRESAEPSVLVEREAAPTHWAPLPEPPRKRKGM